MELKQILETITFVHTGPVRVKDLVELFQKIPDGPQPTKEEIEQAFQELKAEWAEANHGMILDEIADGYEFRTRSEAAPWLRVLTQVKPQKLSTSAIESLSIIAYRQPLTRTEVESIRGVDSGAMMKSLVEKRLIKAIGRKEEAGRSILYATTKEFLELFGLQDLNELPPLSEFEEMVKRQSEAGSLSNFNISDLMIESENIMDSELESADKDVLEDLEAQIKRLKETEKQNAAESTESVPSNPDLATGTS